MLTRKMARFSAVALVGFACMFATEARATGGGESPVGPPTLALTAPLFCEVSIGTKTLRVDTVPMGTPATFPHDVPCPSPGTGTCSEYNYRFTIAPATTLSKSYVTISSDLAIYQASPGAIFINDCIADKTPTNGLNACAQREAQFNSSASPLNASVIVTRSAPRVSTAGAFVGSSSGFCLIQGPGVPGGAFTSVSLSTSEQVAGGKCVADWSFNPAGIVTGVSTSTPGCTAGVGVITADLPTATNELLQDSGGATITSGVDTSSCKVVAGKSYCVCTRAPCP